MRTVLLFATTAALAAGCGQSGTTDSKAKAKDYPIRGKVTAVDEASKKITVDHEDIPGLMKAMEMKFDVESAAAVAGVKAGDRVQGRLGVEAGKYVIKSLKTTESGTQK